MLDKHTDHVCEILIVNVDMFLPQFVAVTFWSIYVYDRELVYPKELDNINPTWLNHSMVCIC